MKKLILSTAMCASLVFAASNPSKLYDYEITPFGSLILNDTKELKDDSYFNVGISIAKNINDDFFNQIELSYIRSDSVDYKNNQETNFNRIFLNAIKRYGITKRLDFYGLMGIGHTDVSKEYGDNKDSFGFDWGVGLRYDIPYYGIALKTDLRHIYSLSSKNNDLVYTFGIGMPLGKRYEEKIEAKVPLVKEEVKVEVPKVDGDDDNDGVANSKDRCPNTLPGVPVDRFGCELDDDQDGVVNRLDRCPDTSPGMKVNEQGCVATIDLKINFDFASAKIKNDYEKVLEDFADILKENPKLRATIEAHTDSIGTESNNQRLSQRRANSAVKALINLGIDKSRLTAIGHGENQPIATNETNSGRAKNRRVTGLINQ